jgi:hypothetical protein|uniref:Uncharacterized protein n=1 Tax=Mimiviridae sp. ChoanoV1 TaxID=2596887 RepID=A0A5B8IHR8_9VIRU|nr:hypothetical protein 3_44 [Mimiviridae sp. ChoanoV1]
MDNQFFKQKLKDSVKEYLNIDNEIATLQSAIKERKKKKDELSGFILGAMKNNEIQQMNINNEKLVYSVSQTKSPLSKTYLNNVLTDYFNNNDKALDVINHILTNRTKVEKVKLKRLSEKKKKINLTE